MTRGQYKIGWSDFFKKKNNVLTQILQGSAKKILCLGIKVGCVIMWTLKKRILACINAAKFTCKISNAGNEKEGNIPTLLL